MLCGISPLVCPELLAALSRMGHGDEIVFADAHFPAESINSFVIRMDGLKIVDLLHGVLPLLALDEYVDFPVIMMAPVDGDTLNEDLITDYRFAIDKHRPQTPGAHFIDRFDFYERAKEAFAVVVTGETRKYGNILLRKGVTTVD